MYSTVCGFMSLPVHTYTHTHTHTHSDMCQLAEKYNALVFLDECHATGFLGDTGRYISMTTQSCADHPKIPGTYTAATQTV